MEELVIKLSEILSTAKRVLVFTHSNPDTDAISSIMAIEYIMKEKFKVPAMGFYSGAVAHPQNVAMVNLLDPMMRPIEDYKPEEGDINILVDTIPSNAGVMSPVNFHVVIDHHRNERSDYNGLLINLSAGSCAATVFYLLEQLGLTLNEDVDADNRLATALLVGIHTDTENLMSDDTTNYDFDAYKSLFELRISDVLHKIVNFDRPKFWIDAKAAAVPNVQVIDGVAVVGMGNIPQSQRDLIADQAQDMSFWSEVHTAIAFAIIDGSRIEGSVRSTNASVSVPNLAKALGVLGRGGGKLGKGAYVYELGGGSINEEDTQTIKDKLVSIFEEKETNRIRRIMKK